MVRALSLRALPGDGRAPLRRAGGAGVKPPAPPDPRVTPRDVTAAKRLWAAYAPEWAKRLLDAPKQEPPRD